MELGENNLIFENKGRIISTFDFSNDDQDINEIEKKQIFFTDGVEENINDNNVEEIEMFRDVEFNNENYLRANKGGENKFSDNFKEYIKLCREMELIQSWTDFEKYQKLKNNY